MKSKEESAFCKLENVERRVSQAEGGLKVIHYFDKHSSRKRYSLVVNHKLHQDIEVDLGSIQDISNRLHIPIPSRVIPYGVGRVGVLYPPFVTLKEYVAENGGSSDLFSLPKFRRILKGWIKSILRMQEAGYRCHISRIGIVIFGDDKGRIIPMLPPFTRQTEAGIEDLNDFKQMRNVLELYDYAIPPSLTQFLECMSLASSKARRQRLLQAPFLIREDKKLWEFIDNICLSMSRCQPYNDALTLAPLPWLDKAEGLNNAEMLGVLLGGEYTDSYAGLILFVRSIYSHSFEKRRSISLIQNLRGVGDLTVAGCVASLNAKDEQDMLTSLRVSNVNSLQNLLDNVVNKDITLDELPVTHTRVVFDFVDGVKEYFFDKVFLMRVTKTISVLYPL